MAHVHTHYDNLKVVRSAPSEVIRAAYKTLSQKFHPDKNPGNSEAARIMAIINASYDVLSNPDKRREHDVWIEQQERSAAQSTRPDVSPRQVPPHGATPKKSVQTASVGSIVAHVLRHWLLYGVGAFLIWIWATDKASVPPPGPKPYQANPAAVRPAYERPSAAPNGAPWPHEAGYVRDYKRLHADGLSTVTVDNSKNDSDVFVKLVSLDGESAYPVRQFYIPALGRFTLNKVTAGHYDIRYRNLSNGALSRSEAFNLEELVTGNGRRYSNVTMTLYKVQNGNLQTYRLSEAEF